MEPAPTVILGAGLSGLSVARALLRQRPDASIVLVDRRTNWERDRTWCFWSTPGLPDADLATERWTRWRTIGADGAVEQRSDRHPYLHLPADRFYEASLTALRDAPNVEIHPGTAVLSVGRGPGNATVVRTSAGELHAGAVVDAMGGRGPLLRDRAPGAIEARQRFLGWEVETERPVFDPAVATLMDFQPGGHGDGVRFMYVLPFSPTRALLEDTSIGGSAIPAADRRAAITVYLEERLRAGAIDVVRTERGSLPMTTFAFPATHGRGLFTAGQAAGTARPSSGYAFARTQRHATELARCLLAGGSAPSALGPRRRRALDAQFLRALQSAPEQAPGWFTALARGVSGDVFARFMSDASSAADETRVMAALAKPGFLAAMAGRSAVAPAHGGDDLRGARFTEPVPGS